MAAHLADPEHNPSFTRGVFLGEIREDLVFPFPELAPEDKESLNAILDSFRAWAAATVDTARLDREGRFGDDVRAGMAELGMMGLNIPEEYGGFGASALLFSRVFGEVGTTDASLAVYFGAHQSIGCKGITLFGTDDQKRRWLPPCATGERVAAFCLTEAGLGLRRAGHAHDGHPQRRRHALRAQRREDLDLQRGLRGRLHRVRQGAGRGGRQAEAARHGVHRRRARARRHARQDRGEDGHQGERHALGVVRGRAGAGRGPARRGRRRLQDRAGDPQLRAAGARRGIVAAARAGSSTTRSPTRRSASSSAVRSARSR